MVNQTSNHTCNQRQADNKNNFNIKTETETDNRYKLKLRQITDNKYDTEAGTETEIYIIKDKQDKKGDNDRYQINTCETEAEIGTDIR